MKLTGSNTGGFAYKTTICYTHPLKTLSIINFYKITMDKIDLTQQFANRLKEALINAGFNSNRSTSGVDIHKLTEITGYSSQICRKYLLGQALPEPAKLVEIAKALKVSPGWLLFGENSNKAKQDNPLTIKKALIRYVFEKASMLKRNQYSQLEVSNFLIGLAEDVSLMQTTDAQSKKIIDLALASASHFER